MHFALEMWEQNRIDNKRKLKPHAVPTIFCFFLKEKVKFKEKVEFKEKVKLEEIFKEPIYTENLQEPTENLVEREHIIHDVQNQDQDEQRVV